MFGKKPTSNAARESHDERRRFKRIKKNFILTYFISDRPHERHEITQLKDISLGGMCFITSKKLAPGCQVSVELRTPYLTEFTHIVGTVLESHEKATNLIYNTRIQFDVLNPEGEVLISKLMSILDGEKN